MDDKISFSVNKMLLLHVAILSFCFIFGQLAKYIKFKTKYKVLSQIINKAKK